MTAPKQQQSANLRDTKREQAQARKSAPKKSPATVSPLPVAEKAAAKYPDARSAFQAPVPSA